MTTKICIFVKVIGVRSPKEYTWEWNTSTSESLNLYKFVRLNLIHKKRIHQKDTMHLWHKDEKILNGESPCSSYERNSKDIIELHLIVVTRLEVSITLKIKFQNKELKDKIPFNVKDTIETLLKYFGLLPEKVVKLMEGDEEELNLIIALLEYDDEPPRKCKIIMMQDTIGRPSDYGKDPKETKTRKEKLQKEGTPICDHRDDVIGDDITLYYPGFQKFIEDSNDASIVLEREDYEFAKRMCTEMSKYFNTEEPRHNEFFKILSLKFKTLKGELVHENKGYKVDISIGTECYILIEVKNESGDSYAQVIGYYVQSLKGKYPDQCPAPAYLLELVGPQLSISGAVFGKYVFVDRLVDSVWLVPHQNEEATIRVARILKALKDAIREIQAYYKNNTRIDNPEFPVFQSCDKGSIQYKERMKRHIFKGTLTYNNGEEVDVIIKFTKRYCREAHALMYKEGCAPQLIHYEERVGGTQYTAVVIEYIDGIMHLDEYLKEYPDNKSEPEPFQDALKVLHDHGFCHGKLTSNNIFMEFKDGKDYINIVNYEWAGRIGEARYPFSADIPDGIEPGDLISKTWDRAQLDKFFDSTDSR
uniref:Protein kinase domain-containing protein n=1 Tax=Amphimedon queenslandica TaxID=400682 RepID=A0A1X7VM59_AMPQE